MVFKLTFVIEELIGSYLDPTSYQILSFLNYKHNKHNRILQTYKNNIEDIINIKLISYTLNLIYGLVEIFKSFKSTTKFKNLGFRLIVDYIQFNINDLIKEYKLVGREFSHLKVIIKDINPKIMVFPKTIEKSITLQYEYISDCNHILPYKEINYYHIFHNRKWLYNKKFTDFKRLIVNHSITRSDICSYYDNFINYNNENRIQLDLQFNNSYNCELYESVGEFINYMNSEDFKLSDSHFIIILKSESFKAFITKFDQIKKFKTPLNNNIENIKVLRFDDKDYINSDTTPDIFNSIYNVLELGDLVLKIYYKLLKYYK
jgi:hypothetical protein